MKLWFTSICLVYLLFLSHGIAGQNLPLACGGSKAKYTVKNPPGSFFQWEVAGGAIIKNDNNSVDIQWDKNEGIHLITVNQYNPLSGCKANPVYGYVMVSVPTFSLDKDISICDGKIFTLKANVTYKSILWSTGSTASSVQISKPGYYKASVTFDDGCKAQDSTYVAVIPNPVFSLGRDTTICDGESITLDPKTNVASYVWSTGETTPTIQVNLRTGMVWARLTDDHGCSSIDTLLITSCSQNALKKLVPNAFTPNNDNDNDTWRIDILVNYPDASVAIYNRWGQSVYKTDRNYPSQGWDGTSNGRALPMDTYFYVIDLKDGSKPIMGSINLIR